MTDILLEYLPLILSFFLANICVALIICAWLIGRYKNKQDIQFKKLQANLNILTSGSLGMGQRMIALEQKINGLQSTQEEMKQSDMDFSFSCAQKLIEQGVDSHTIAANSGLSSSEIQLMQLLHGTRSRPQDLNYG